MDKETLKFYELKTEIIQAAAHPLRLAIIEFLVNGEQCVCDIVEHVGAERSNISRHLSLMSRSGVLESRKEGLKVFYSLKTPCILKFIGCVEEALRERMIGQAALLSRLS